MRGRHDKIKLNILMCLACVLFCLTLISVHLCSGLYARYTAYGTGSDSARVAQWSVSASGNKPALTIDCTNDDFDDEYKITVTNNSEVSVKYDIVLNFAESLPESITIKLDGSKAPAVSNSRKTFTFTNVGSFVVGSASTEHSLVFTADADEIDEDVTFSFTGTVKFEQID